ncbi:MAG: quinoprotein relay system zinc metallohydrolase 2 [Gammaproteobacteria bacterium]|nr:quinoprotein relay system zinc metallohydrolase 2 [Gammaproteobacteria bacterium]
MSLNDRPGTFQRSPALWVLTVSMLFAAHEVQANGPQLEFVEVAPGIYLHLGKHEEMSVDNLGDIANIGFIVGTESVAVIDPGGSPQLGIAMRDAIRDLTGLPVSHVILTHIHPDHIFGGSAFADVEFIVAHRNFVRALAQRGDYYREGYSALFVDENMPTSLQPTMEVADKLRIDLGERRLIVRAHKTAHTDNDLSIFDSVTRTLWASDLIFAQRIPSLDGSLTGWLKAMDELAVLQADLVIPGHGRPGSWATVAEPQQRYLNLLLSETREMIARNARLSDAVDKVAAEESKSWILYDSHHRGNVTKAHTELEWE